MIDKYTSFVVFTLHFSTEFDHKIRSHQVDLIKIKKKQIAIYLFKTCQHFECLDFFPVIVIASSTRHFSVAAFRSFCSNS